ncbi:MAG: glutamine--tRNA ligase/YqeY domain fusion protein [Candidatus Thermoplasmatota archaeon]|nr:glutamine--tRNA ligase/YqeY domain fusion protein [Candidatus Thermoplasmatota archaeon]
MAIDDLTEKKDFIREIIDEDIKNNTYQGRIHTRFPPEPNGYLHIGHAKSICLNFGIAKEYGGLCNLRFDDTNPTKEEDEYVHSIIEDVRWLGFDWEDRLFFASDYFQQMYEYAIQLIQAGYAYVDDLSAKEISETRGTITQPGTNSPYRNRSVDENLSLFQKMKEGAFLDGEKVLRAKIDMNHPNLNMRDPVMYRVLHATHHRTKDTWCIYPMYDWAHGLEDSIENITHSICTLEFENHRPLYDWFLDKLQIYHPQQIEFARLNLSYTIMSKRMLLNLVQLHHVNGWDDPRLPTISGMRRRGYSPESIRAFCSRIGVAKVNSTVDFEFLEHCVREHLNQTCPRYMGVLHPLKVIIDNYQEETTEELEAMINPERPEEGTRNIHFTKELYIEKTDFMKDPPKKFFRLTLGREVRLRYAYLLTCTDVIEENDEIVELHGTIDPASKGGYAPDGRKVKSTIHWVSASNAVDAEIRLYDRLFTVKEPTGQKDTDFKEFLNPASLEILQSCKVEPTLKQLKPFERFQFERLGYFCIDPETNKDDLVINRTVNLKDTWAKVQDQGKN